MNLKRLIEAAKEIDRLAEKSEARAKAWLSLAADAKKPDADRHAIEQRRQILDAGVVVDFGTAIDRLRAAIHDR